MWSLLDDALLREALSYLDVDDAYRLWVAAEENDLMRVREYLTVSSDFAPLSQARAKHLAVAFASWTAVRRLSKPQSTYLDKQTIDRILHEIARIGGSLRPHPDREAAMRTAARRASVPEFVMYFAARLGNIESVIWLHHVARYDPSEALEIAARHDHGTVVGWLLDNLSTAQVHARYSTEAVFRSRDDPAFAVDAWQVKDGDKIVSSFGWTQKWGFADTAFDGQYRIVDLAAINGDLDGVQQLSMHPILKTAYSSSLVDDTVRAGHLHVLKWLYETHRKLFQDTKAFESAVAAGHLHVAQWLATQRLEGDSLEKAFQSMARHGHLDMLRWATETFPTSAALYVDESLLCFAAQAGHLPIVQWLVNKRRRAVLMHHLNNAASGGHFEVFLWVLDRLEAEDEAGAPLAISPVLLKQAAQSGNMKLVRWLVEVRGMWNPHALTFATRNPSTEMIEYLYATAVARGKGIPTVFAATFDRGEFATLTWILKHGCTRRQFRWIGFGRLRRIIKAFALKMEQLGWPECAGPDWPCTYATMAQFHKVLGLVIDVYDPSFLCAVAWLPTWAVEYGTVKNLERLTDIDHPNMLQSKTFRLLLRTSTNADKVKWFLKTSPALFSTRVVQWAVKFDQRHFLTWLFADFLPARQAEGGDDATLTIRSRQIALFSARKHVRQAIALLLPHAE